MIGSGSWATAITKIILEDSQRKILWWVRQPDVRDHLISCGCNPLHLTSIHHDAARLTISCDLAATVAAADTLILAVPSVYTAQVLASLPPHSLDGKRMVSAVKGYISDGQMSVSEYLHSVHGIPENDICVVSGPSHAEEVAEEKPTFLTIASCNLAFANEIADLLRCRYIHTSVSNEVHTIELCGLTKNVYAIAAGIAAGLGYGDNLIAILTTASAHELQGIIPETPLAFRLLSDLIVTCFSRHSRNRVLGEAVAQGISPEEHFRSTGMVAEGYYSAQIMHHITKAHPTPIAEAVYHVLYDGADPHQCIDHLIDNVF